MIMEEWKEYKLSELCNIFTGKKDVNKTTPDGAYPFFSCAPTPYKSSEYIYDGKAIIVAGNGSFTGRVTCYSGKFDLYQRTYACVPIVEEVNFIYLYYYMKAYFEPKYMGGTRGSSIPYIVKGDLADFKVQLPSLNKQGQISSILASLDDKIEVNRRINENLEQQAQALFKSWFVDFEPFKDQPFVESELGMIPQGWKVDNIYKYLDVIYGAPYKSALFNEEKNGMPLIRIRDLKTNSPQFFTPEILNTTEYIEAGDIVAGMDAEFTPYLWLGDKGVLNQRCCKFKGKYKGISNYFILFFVKPKLEFVQSYKTGTTVSHLGKSDIDRFKFITPPLDVVRVFSKIVNPIKEDVVNRALESRRLAELRDTLLPRLMSGELRVTNMDLVNKLMENNIF